MKSNVVVVGSGAVAQALGTFLQGKDLSCTVLPIEQVFGDAAIRRAGWVVEAAGDDIQSKRAALAAIAQATGDDCLVTSDASVHTRAELLTHASAEFAARHAVVHFFFPVDRLPLVELVTASGRGVEPMRGDAEARLRTWLVDGLQRRIVECADLPGYIANRVGFGALAQAMTLADAHGMAPGRADGALNQLLGWPRTGAFGTVDLISPAQFVALANALVRRLDEADPLVFAMPAALHWIGRLEQCGADRFYRRSGKGQPPLEVDFHDGSYQASSQEPISVHEEGYARELQSWISAYIDLVANQAGLSVREVWQVMAGSYGWRVPEAHTPPA